MSIIAELPKIEQKTKNLHTMDDLSLGAIHEVLDIAEIMAPYARKRLTPPFAHKREVPPGFPEGTIAPWLRLFLMCLEKSLRTWGTMATAGDNLSMLVRAILGLDMTALLKGEGLGHNDLMAGVVQMPDVYAIRSPYDGASEYAAIVLANAQKTLEREEPIQTPVINLGDQTNAHPTQVLGNLSYLRERFGRLDGFTLGITGGLELSRTAADDIRAARICGYKVRLFCDEDSLPPANVLAGFDNFEHHSTWDGISDCDVVSFVRPQFERSEQGKLDYQRALERWKLNSNVLDQMKPDAFLMHAQPMDDISDLVPVWPGMYDSDRFRPIQITADRMVQTRMAILHVVLENRAEPTIVPEATKITTPPIVTMTMVEKRRQLDAKIKVLKKRGVKPQFFRPIDNGTVIDKLYGNEASILFQWLEHKGYFSMNEPGIKAPIGPVEDGNGSWKSFLVLENIFLLKEVMAAIQVAFPKIVFNVCDTRRGRFRKFRFVPSRLNRQVKVVLTPRGILPCPNPECATNHCSQGETAHQVGTEESWETVCSLCKRKFPGAEIKRQIRRIVSPMKKQGITN